MANIAKEQAIHVEWIFPFADSVSVSALHTRLIAGQKLRLFDIRHWDSRDGQVTAILSPEAPFEEVVAHIWSTGHRPSRLWVEERDTDGHAAGTGYRGPDSAPRSGPHG